MGGRLSCIGALIALLLLLSTVARGATVPTPALDLPEITYQAGLLGDAQLGAAVALVGELIDKPDDFRTSAAQTFINQTFAELAKTDRELSPASIDEERAALRPSGLPPSEISRQYYTFQEPIPLSRFGDRKAAFFVGMLTSQVAFNAAVLHDLTAGNTFRRLLAGIPAIDSYFPGAADLRHSLLPIGDTDWRRAYVAAHALQLLIVRAGTLSSTQEPIAILVGGRRITDPGPRKDTLHTFIEFIAQDGTRRTLAGYPDGNWSAPRGVLHCRLDREPATVADISFVLLGTANGPASVMNSLVTSCQAFETNSTTQPLMYSATGLTDNSVVSSLIDNVSPNDAPPLMRLMTGHDRELTTQRPLMQFGRRLVIAGMVRVRYADRLTAAMIQPEIDVAAKYGNFTTFPAQDLILNPSR